MATVRMRAGDLRAAMRDRRYWQAGHPERATYAAWVSEGWQRLHGPDATTEGGERIVQVQAYDRTRNGRREQVDAYTQRRPAGRGGTGDAVREAPPRAAAQSAPTAAPQQATLVIFVGGLLDGTTELAKGISNAIQNDARASQAAVEVQYASHDEPSRLRSWIRDAQPGTRIVVVGHSWGADTAAQTVARLGQEGRLVDLLVTIDPVGRGLSDDYLRRVRAGALEWVNVNAAGGDRSNFTNQIAEAGGAYGSRPQRFASQHIDTPFAHGDFGPMLHSIAPGGAGSLIRRLQGQ